jgi:hypothetical protein
MNLTHIDPIDVIDKTALHYKKTKSANSSHLPGLVLSRQVQALAYVLTEEINDALLEIENASDS